MIIWLCVILLLTWSLYKLYTFYSLPNGPWGLPIVGYLPFIDKHAPHITMSKLSNKYGPIFSVKLGSVVTVVISDPKLIRKVFSRDEFSGRAPLYLTHGIMKGYGIVCAEGDLWKDQRKLAIHCLKNFNVTSMLDILTENINNLLNDLENEFLNKNEVIFPRLSHYFGNVISYIIFGQKWSLDDKTWKYLQFLQEEGVKHIGVAGPLNFLPFLRFLPKYQNSMDFLLIGKFQTHGIYDRFINEELLNPKHDIKSAIAYFLDEMDDVKSHGRSTRTKFYSKRQLLHFIADLFGGAFDTTFATLCWMLLFLMKYPEIQEKCYQEIDREFNTLHDIDNLMYLQATFCEVQRIRTVVPLGIPHGTRCDTNIGEYRIPKNTMIIPLQWHVHMNENNWENADVFSPERFLNSDGQFTRNEYFMPFQFGKRMCIGEQLAKLLLFSFTIRILQKFEIRSANASEIDLDGEIGIFFTPKPNPMILKKRVK